MKCGPRTAYFCLSSSWHFLCRAVDIFEKSVEQSRFEQMHLEQLTLTHFFNISFMLQYVVAASFVSWFDKIKLT
jgi:hypothetical protein